MSILQIAYDGNDGDHGIYVNMELVASVHCNDLHELPSTLYELMVKYNFDLIQELQLLSEAQDLYHDVFDGQHPKSIMDYNGWYRVSRAYKRGESS